MSEEIKEEIIKESSTEKQSSKKKNKRTRKNEIEVIEVNPQSSTQMDKEQSKEDTQVQEESIPEKKVEPEIQPESVQEESIPEKKDEPVKEDKKPVNTIKEVTVEGQTYQVIKKKEQVPTVFLSRDEIHFLTRLIKIGFPILDIKARMKRQINNDSKYEAIFKEVNSFNDLFTVISKS